MAKRLGIPLKQIYKKMQCHPGDCWKRGKLAFLYFHSGDESVTWQSMRKMKIMGQINNLICFGKHLGSNLTYWKNSHEKFASFFPMRFFGGENSCDPESMSKLGFRLLGFVESEKTTIEASSGDEHPKFTFSSCSHMAGSFPWRLALDSGTGWRCFCWGVGFD